MYTYNITFILPPDKREKALDWISKRFERFVASDSFTGTGLTISQVVEVPGMPDYGVDSVSITAQVHFKTLEEAQAWGAARMQAIAAAFSGDFGAEALAMPSILQNLQLNGR